MAPAVEARRPLKLEKVRQRGRPVTLLFCPGVTGRRKKGDVVSTLARHPASRR
jgi:hypothetical protein